MINYLAEDYVKEEFDEKDSNELFSDNQFEFLKTESCDMNDDETFEDIKINPEIPDFYDESGNNESEEKYQETEFKNCSKCDETFSNLSELVEHFNEKHKPTNGQYVCPLCPKEEFENFENLNKHINRIHLKSEKKPTKKKKHRKTRTSKNVQCDYCQLFFHQKGNLKKHIDKYHPEEVNQYNDEFQCKTEDLEVQTCSKCNKNFKNLMELTSHFNKDHERIDNQWQCPICSKNYANQTLLSFHVKSTHLDVKKKCSECDDFYPLKSFKHHMKTMHGSEFFKCEKCEYWTSEKGNYKRHLRVMHPNKKREKSFLCDDCDQKFEYAYLLKHHKEKVHEGISKKLHLCDECDKMFEFPHQVKNHKNMVHLGIAKKKSHFCDMCDKKFEFPCLLRDHKDSAHNGLPKTHENSCFCKKCNQNFENPSQLKKHSNLVHNGIDELDEKKENLVQEPMECKSCSTTFKFPSVYIKHYQDTHSSLPPEYVDKQNFMCDQCPSVFILKQHLRKHIQQVHSKIYKKSKVIYLGVLTTIWVRLDM